MIMEWSVRLATIISEDRVGRGLAVVHDGKGYLRVGNLQNDRMYLTDDAKVDVARIGNGYYVGMKDAIGIAGSLVGCHHADLLETAVNIDVLGHRHHDGPRVAAFITPKPWIHIDGISFPTVDAGDVLVYVEDVYRHFGGEKSRVTQTQ